LVGILENQSQIKWRAITVVQNRKYSRNLIFLAVSLLFSICFVFFTGAQGLRVYDLSKVEIAPRIIKRVSPMYPLSAKIQGLEIRAKVRIKCLVDKDGIPQNIWAAECDPEDALNIFGPPAVRSVSQWEFSPGKIAGEPVATRIAFWVDFELDE
jgi:hypothetical protein